MSEHRRLHKLPACLKRMKRKLEKQLSNPVMKEPTPLQDQLLVTHILEQTRINNLNNVTRTNAYLHFYQKFPEVHWAFLGHMVSRNGGWNMTDLKGDLITKLLNKEEQDRFFFFLERGNWLIFQDIYPQMLLYEETIRRQSNLFDLLPWFHVSQFMHVIWNEFLERQEKHLLTLGLIINEQSYLEKRVIQNPSFQNVLGSLEFKLHELLSFNQIIFPYEEGRQVTMVGQTINQFASLHERIQLGKRLYQLLFNEKNYSSIFKWALQHTHTASRKDYYSSLYNDVNESIPGKPSKFRTKNCSLKPKVPRIFSPQLQYTYPNINHEKAEAGDWFSDTKIVNYLEEYTKDVNGAISNDYCKKIEKIEFAIFAKENLFS